MLSVITSTALRVIKKVYFIQSIVMQSFIQSVSYSFWKPKYSIRVCVLGLWKLIEHITCILQHFQARYVYAGTRTFLFQHDSILNKKESLLTGSMYLLVNVFTLFPAHNKQIRYEFPPTMNTMYEKGFVT